MNDAGERSGGVVIASVAEGHERDPGPADAPVALGRGVLDAAAGVL